MRGGRRRWLVRTAGSVAAIVLGIGALHLPIARPLLAKLEVFCPVSGVTANQVEALQSRAARSMAGKGNSPIVDLIGLQLLRGGDTAQQMWIDVNHLRCEQSARGFQYVSCMTVPASALRRDSSVRTETTEVIMTHDQTDRTVGIDLLSRFTDDDAAAAQVADIRRRLTTSLGEPHETIGWNEPGSFADPFHTVSLRYKFTDCLILFTATAIPGSGVVLREQYIAVRSEGSPTPSSSHTL